MGTQIDKNVLMSAINSREVLTNLKKKNVNLTEKSYLVFGNDGSVRVDIDGDGIYDKTITGLVDKKGRINTEKFDVDTDKTASDVQKAKAKYDQANNDYKKSMDAVKSYETKDGTFDEEKAQQNAEKAFKEKLAEFKKENAVKSPIDKNTLIREKRRAKSMFDELQAKDTDNMTTKQLKEHKKAQDNAYAAMNSYSKALAEYNTKEEAYYKKVEDFKKTKDAFMKENVAQQKKDYEAAKTNAGKQFLTSKTLLAKYNDALEEAGYGNEAQRQEYKEKRFKIDPNSEKVADKQNSLIESVVTNYVAQNTALKNRISTLAPNGSYSIEIHKNGEAKVYVNDGDKIADITITGFYNAKNGKVSTEGIKWTENADSTSNRKSAMQVFNNARKAFVEFMNANPTSDIDSKEAKELKNKLQEAQKQLKKLNISDEDVKNFKVEA